MKFSVIVPIYNAEKYIHECVSSVLNQSYKNFEIVLVDDGSTDSSASICDALANEYDGIIKVIHQKNRGQLLSRCTGVDESTGDYCVFIDADDLLFPNCLERLYDAINDFSLPDIVIYNFERMYSSGKKLCKPISLEGNFIYANEQKTHIYELLVSGSTLNSMCNKCIKRDCIANLGDVFIKYQSLRCGEDRIQVLEAVTRAERILFIEDKLYCYRLFEGSVTRNFDVTQLSKFNMKTLCNVETDYLYKWNVDIDEWQKKLEANYLNNVAYTFLLFYDNIKKLNVRNQLIKYSWFDFVPGDYILKVDGNPYISDFYKILWKCVIARKYTKIRMLLLKRSIYKIIKTIKGIF